MMLIVYYSPHSTSVDNEAGRASGHADVPLSSAGKIQTEQMKQHYAQLALDAIFCSDLQRAYTTAEIAFANRDIVTKRDARLRECDYGLMTQYPSSEIDFRKHVSFPFPQGESVEMVVNRVRDFLRDQLFTHNDKTILVIAHRATRYALEYLSGTRSLYEVVSDPDARREIPIWRYEFKDLIRL